MSLFVEPRQSPTSGGNNYAGAKYYFYLTGTTTPAAIYTDADRTTQHANPVIADSGGVFEPIWLDPTALYRRVLKSSAGATISDVDPYPGASINQDELGGVLWPQTAAEIAAGVTPAKYYYEPLPIIDLRRYGLDTAASGATNRSAIEQAIDVASVLAGAILQAPPGTYVIDATVTIDVNRVLIQGSGPNATIWSFDPAGTDVLFHFTRGASSFDQGGIRACGFISANSVTKTAIQIDDGRHTVVEDIGISNGNWPGSGSIGIYVKGRDALSMGRLAVLCARPLLFGQNPNHASLDMDHFHFKDFEVGSTETTGKCIEIEDGVVLTNVTFDGYQAWVLGKYGIYWSDTSSPTDSYSVVISGLRTEQATDATGYSIYLASTAQDLKSLQVTGYFDPGRGGIYLRRPEQVTLLNCLFAGNSGVTNLDVTFQSATQLSLINCALQPLSTVTLTNAVQLWASPLNTAQDVIPKTVTYRYDEAALVSRKSSRTDGVFGFRYKGTVADDGQLNLPVLSSGGADVAHIRIAMGAAGPILEGGSAVWRPGTVTLTGVSANVVNTNTDTKLCIIDNTNALSVINRLGAVVDVVIDVVWSD